MKAIVSLTLALALTLAARAGDVSLAWDPNTEPDLTGYTLYWGRAPGQLQHSMPVGNVTLATVRGLGNGEWYFAVTASNSAGLESVKSEQVSATVEEPPGKPSGLREAGAGASGGAVIDVAPDGTPTF